MLLNPPRATLTIGENSVSRLLEGIGVNWNDAFGMGGENGMGLRDMPLNTPVIPLLDNATEWDVLLSELTFLKAGCLRFLLPPEGFITKRGTIDFDCVHFQRLERLNAWAGANGASIILDTIHVPHHLQVKGEDAPGYASFNRAAADPLAFAEKFAGPLLEYCVAERNWTQIRYYNPVSTPLYGGVYHHPKGDSFRAYAGMLAALRKELIERGLVPQRLSLMGPSSPALQRWPIPDFHARGLDLNPLLDAYDQHEYSARFDGDEPNANIDSLEMTDLLQQHLQPHVAYAKSHNKPFLITELGHQYYGGRLGDPNGPSTHDAFLLDAEFSVRAINAGVQGLLRWSFLNPGDINGRWQLLDSVDGSLRRVDNTYYGYATLIRYARPHADVLNVQVESSLRPYPCVHACALRKAPQGDITVLIVNDHPSEQVELTVKLPATLKPRKLNVIRNDRTLKHALTGEFKRDGKGGSLLDKLPPRSLTVYTSLEYDPLLR
jgi:hypothetical protein